MMRTIRNAGRRLILWFLRDECGPAGAAGSLGPTVINAEQLNEMQQQQLAGWEVARARSRSAGAQPRQTPGSDRP